MTNTLFRGPSDEPCRAIQSRIVTSWGLCGDLFELQTNENSNIAVPPQPHFKLHPDKHPALLTTIMDIDEECLAIVNEGLQDDVQEVKHFSFGDEEENELNEPFDIDAVYSEMGLTQPHNRLGGCPEDANQIPSVNEGCEAAEENEWANDGVFDGYQADDDAGDEYPPCESAVCARERVKGPAIFRSRRRLPTTPRLQIGALAKEMDDLMQHCLLEAEPEKDTTTTPQAVPIVRVRRLRGSGPAGGLDPLDKIATDYGDSDVNDESDGNEERAIGASGMDRAVESLNAAEKRRERQQHVAKRKREAESRARDAAKLEERRKAERRARRQQRKSEKEEEIARQVAARQQEPIPIHGPVNAGETLFEPKLGAGVINNGRNANDECIPEMLFLDRVKEMNKDRVEKGLPVIDEKILIQLIDAKIRKEDSHGISTSLKVEIDLLMTLLDSGCPLNVFGKVFSWAQRSAQRQNFSFQDHQPRKREDVMSEIYLINDMVGLVPMAVPCELIGAPSPVEVIVHDVRQQIYSILTDQTCMKDENMIWKRSPFDKPVRRKTLDDIDDGVIYRQAHKEFVKVPKLHVPLGLLMFIDKTIIDMLGNNGLEPVLFTLGIFNRKFRNRREAWRVAGYVINQSKFKYKSTEHKLTDYHTMMRIILDSVAATMKAEGIAWCVDFRGRRYNVVFRPYVQFIIGDTMGHNSICNHYQTGGNKGVARACRICDIAPENRSKPYTPFTYTKMEDIRGAKIDPGNRNARDLLKAISYHNVENAFHCLRYVMGHEVGEELVAWIYNAPTGAAGPDSVLPFLLGSLGIPGVQVMGNCRNLELDRKAYKQYVNVRHHIKGRATGHGIPTAMPP